MGKSAEVRLAFFKSKSSKTATVIRVEDRWQDMLDVVADEFELDPKTVKLFGNDTTTEPDEPGTSANKYRFTRSSWPAVLDMPRFRLFAPKDTGHIVVEGSSNAEHVCRLQNPIRSRVETKDGSDRDYSSEPDSSPGRSQRSAMTPSPPTPKMRTDGRIEAIAQLTDGARVPFVVKMTTKLNKLKVALADRCGADAALIRLLLDGQRIGKGQTVEDLSHVPRAIIRDREGRVCRMMLEALFDRAGGKPVIYLWPPTELVVALSLALCPEWSFSAIYPPTPIVDSESEKEAMKRVDWVVRARPDDTLMQSTTGLNVSYLFWEAHTNKTKVNDTIAGANEDAGINETAGTNKTASGQASKIKPAFRPAHTRLHPGDTNVIVVAVDQIPLYLDAVLKVLGLHTEARTSFITYWLPSFLRHKYVALTFVPQTDYEQAAPLYINPKPDVVTRVFMLFQGIKLDEMSSWSDAQTRAGSDIGFWRGVIGVASYERQADSSLFRVLEWGGMEIK